MSEIHQYLLELDPEAIIKLNDETHRHVQHSGYTPGRHHFKAEIHSDKLSSLPKIKAHRLVIQAIKPCSNKIHAFSIQIKSLC